MTPEAILAHRDQAAPWPADRPSFGRTDVAAAYRDTFDAPFDSLAVTFR